MFAKNVPVPNTEPRRLVFVFQVLGRFANDTTGEKTVFRADAGPSRQINMRPDDAPGAQFHSGINNGKRTNHDGWVEVGPRSYDCSWMNHVAQSEPCPDPFPSQMWPSPAANRPLSIATECVKIRRTRKQISSGIMKTEPKKSWTSAEDVLALARTYQGAAVLGAAADLDLFDAVKAAPGTAAELAAKLSCNTRALTVLLDALTSLGLLEKWADRYAVPANLEEFLTAETPRSVLAMVQHQANCLRRWAQLASVVKSGRPVCGAASVRGDTGDQQAFIGAMHNISAPTADHVIRAVQPLRFQHLLDLGGASGTWTIAFLRACPAARGTLFDLPHVIPMAEQRLGTAGLRDRVTLAPGDFMTDKLPVGADLAWVSAIVHQNSRAQNRIFFANIFQALAPGGRIAIRDVLMEHTRTSPQAGALFAVNMLVATEGGGTFTFEELKEDLGAAGFTQAAVQRRDEGMNSIVVAHKRG
jgi:hypothetical protein